MKVSITAVAGFFGMYVAQRLLAFSPSTPLADGIGRFVAWYRDFYR
jgi:nucleoside-diphosphate-sugar epimerase